MRKVNVVAALIEKNGCFLLAQRASGSLKGKWEFPGGKVEDNETPEDALKTAIYLNDKYAYDAPSANGYVGILWAIGGLHDRAFSDYPVTGKIRRMTYNSIKHKFDLSVYLRRFS